MPNKLQSEQPKDEMERSKRESLDNRIKEQVIHALGTPIDLRNVQVRKVWSGHYRVNVIVAAPRETTGTTEVPGNRRGCRDHGTRRKGRATGADVGTTGTTERPGNRYGRRESDTGDAESHRASEQSACECGKASVTQRAAAEQSACQGGET